jgi:hypothetical protein
VDKIVQNGFRVLPYGEPNDDWLGLIKDGLPESASINIPFANRNLSVCSSYDRKGELFEETCQQRGY